MPPGPAYNWFCVLYSAGEILSHAARYRAAQVIPRNPVAYTNSRKRRRTEEPVEIPIDVVVKDVPTKSPNDNAPLQASESSSNIAKTFLVETLDTSRKPNEFPDALEPVKKSDNVFDAHPEEIVASGTKESVLHQTVYSRSSQFSVRRNLITISVLGFSTSHP